MFWGIEWLDLSGVAGAGWWVELTQDPEWQIKSGCGNFGCCFKFRLCVLKKQLKNLPGRQKISRQI